MTTEEFAFGRNEVGDCGCPATTAGPRPSCNESVRVVADKYDEKVREQIHTDVVETPNGIVHENVAKGCWLAAIEALEENGEEIPARFGRVVADELGWLDE